MTETKHNEEQENLRANIYFLVNKETHNEWISRKEVAQRLQISPASLGKYTSGERMPSLAHLLNIAAYFDTGVDDLLYTRLHKPEPGQTAKEAYSA